MDPLITVSQVHYKIYELPNMYQKILQSVNFYNVLEYTKSLNQLFKDTIVPHFEFEENEIFPVAFVRDELRLARVAAELIQEHGKIMEKLAKLNEANAALAGKPDVQQREKDKLTAFCTEITQELTNHAQREDAEFYPFLKDITFTIK